MNRITTKFFVPVCAAALLVSATAEARPKADPSTLSTAIKNDVVDAVAMEMVRALTKLRIPRAPSPYFIGYKITEVEVNDVNASLGATTARKQRHFVNLEAHVRTGDYKFDNSNFVVSRSAGTDGVSAITLSLEPSPKIARRAAWLVTDAAYKEALAQLLAKIDHSRAGGSGTQGVPSYTKHQAVVDEKPKLVPRLESNAELEARANKISAVFRKQNHLRDSRVAFTSFLERRWYLNSEGTNAHDTRRVSGVVIAVTAQADDGQDLALYYSRYGMTAADLPGDAELIAEAKKLSQTMALLRKAPVMSNYTGPVLFEGAGAVGLTRYTLAPHLGGTPIPAGLEKGQAKRFGGALADRIGFRAISPLLSLTDDPTMSSIGKRRLIGGYRYDDEGTPAQRVDVIKDGKLVTLLSSRTPSKAVPKSNGHARRDAPGGDFHGSATNLVVTGKRGKSSKQLERLLVREAKAQGHKYGLVITQLDDAAITSAPELSRREMYRLLNDTDVDEPPPALLAYKLHPNGKRELVRGVQLKPITMRTWRDVLAVGKNRTIANFLASTENHLSHKLQGVGTGSCPPPASRAPSRPRTCCSRSSRSPAAPRASAISRWSLDPTDTAGPRRTGAAAITIRTDLMGSAQHIRVHAEEARSRANGPGSRYTVWVQGCTLGCPGCFNATTHETGGPVIAVAELAARIAEQAARELIDGLTLSGGEPLQQPDAVLALLDQVREATELSVVLFSGYTRAEIESMPLGPRILSRVDVLIDGRYEARLRVGTGLRGSDNQRVHLLTDRYTAAEIASTPQAEIRIAPDGSFTMSGVAPVKVK